MERAVREVAIQCNAIIPLLKDGHDVHRETNEISNLVHTHTSTNE